MPRRLSLVNRATTDLHAPWWSDAKDPTTGRYLERVTVYTRLTYADQQWVQEQLFSSGALDLAALTQLAQASQGKRAEEALPSILSDQSALGGAGLAGLVASEGYALLVRLAELTDETGEPLPLRDASGHLLPGALDLLGELDAEDMNWIREQVQQLDARDAVVPVLPQDAEVAAANQAKLAAGMPAEVLGSPDLVRPEGVAQDSFRPASDGSPAA